MPISPRLWISQCLLLLRNFQSFGNKDAYLVVYTLDRRHHESGVGEFVHEHADGRCVNPVAGSGESLEGGDFDGETSGSRCY